MVHVHSIEAGLSVHARLQLLRQPRTPRQRRSGAWPRRQARPPLTRRASRNEATDRRRGVPARAGAARIRAHGLARPASLHCKACDLEDPYEIITRVPPGGGSGPNYQNL